MDKTVLLFPFYPHQDTLYFKFFKTSEKLRAIKYYLNISLNENKTLHTPEVRNAHTNAENTASTAAVGKPENSMSVAELRMLNVQTRR